MTGRVEVEGRHLRLNEERFVVKGTAYGPFAPRTDGARYPEPARVRADFEAITAMGLNTIRTHDVPPPDLIRDAADLGLRLLIGLDYPDWRFEPFPDRASARRVADAGMAAVDRLFARVDDPSVILAVSVGRAIPADLVRVHQEATVADTLSSFIDRVHALDPMVPATYTARGGGDPLRGIDGCDLTSIVLDVDTPPSFEQHLTLLQLCGPTRPVVVTDLDAVPGDQRPYEEARQLSAYLIGLDRSGCAGATVGAWVADPQGERPYGGDPSVSLVTDGRTLKPTGRAVETWAGRDVKDLRAQWPRVTAVVRTHNNELTIERCLTALEMSDYHDLEVIVCDQGSTDATVSLARRYPFTVVAADEAGTDGPGETGINAASGEIVAFIDGDVECHAQWPWFIALAFERDEQVAAVGRYVSAAEPDGGLVARCMAALGDIDRLPSTDATSLLASGSGGLAVRRSVFGEAGPSLSGSGVIADTDLVHRLVVAGSEDAVVLAPAAQAVHPTPNSLRAVWHDAVEEGGADKEQSELHPNGSRHGADPIRRLINAYLNGDRQPRAVTARALLDLLAWPLLITAGVTTLAAAFGLGLLGLVPAVVATAVLTALIGVVAADVVAADRPSHPLGAALTVAAIVLLQPPARAWGRHRTRFQPRRPAGYGWTGDREKWLGELRWRLRRQRLLVTTPGGRSPWDIDVRCGLFLRQLIVTAVAWQWTPHVRSVLRPRWLLVAPIAVAATTALWSPMAAAMIVSATVGELAFEVVTLRCVDGIINGSVSGSLPPVGSAADERPIEMAARSTLDL